MSLPFDLHDSRWANLTTAYGTSAEGLPELLHRAYASNWEGDLLGEIFNEVCHQGDTSEAMYAVAPHLIALAGNSTGEQRAHLAILAGFIHATAQKAGEATCPAFLADGFAASAKAGMDLILRALSEDNPINFEILKGMFTALAAFKGHGRFGLLIDEFDYHEGKFYHPVSDEPLEA